MPDDGRWFEGIAARLLQRWANVSGGMYGLRKLGTGDTDAAPGGSFVAITRTFNAQPQHAPPGLTIEEIRALSPHPVAAPPPPDDAQAVIASRVFGR